MKFYRSLTIFLAGGHTLLMALAIPPTASAAEDVVIREQEGFADMLGQSGWRPDGSGYSPSSSLLIDNPQGRETGQWRRGAHRITGFGLTGPAADGQGDATRPTDAPRGISWSASPAKLPSEQLTVTGTYIHSAPQENQSPTGGKPSGSAGAIALDSKLPLKGELRLHGEVAYSNFDADGSSDWLDGENGSAFAAGLSYAPKMKGKTQVQIDAGFRQVAPGFRSVANPSLRDDQRKMHLGGRLNREGLSLRGEVSRTLDNVSENSATPTLKTDTLQVQADYAPSGDSAGDGFSLFAKPRFSAGLSRSLTESTGEGTVPATDRAVSTLNLSMAFAPGPAQWSLEHSMTREEDYTDFYLDHLNRKNRLSMALPLNSRARLSSTLEQNRSEYENGYALDETRAAFRLSLTGKNNVQSTFSVVHHQRESSDGGVDQASLSADVRVDKPLPALPGDPKVWFGGKYDFLASEDAEKKSGFEIFFGIEMKLGTS